MNQAYFAITTTSRYATNNRSQTRRAGFSSISDGRYLMLGLSGMEMDLGRNALSQVEGAEDQKSEQRKSNHRDHPPFEVSTFTLEGISGLQECVTHKISQSHVVTIPKQLFEFRVY